MRLPKLAAWFSFLAAVALVVGTMTALALVLVDAAKH